VTRKRLPSRITCNGLPSKDPLAYDKAMKRIILIAIALTVICSGNGYAFDKTGLIIYYGSHKCNAYLDAYSRTTFVGTNSYGGPRDFAEMSGWIDGYMTAINSTIDNGKSTILANQNGAEMSLNDAYKWLASWCRDNPSKGLSSGIFALANSRSKN
jgi:hypothetical protein